MTRDEFYADWLYRELYGMPKKKEEKKMSSDSIEVRYYILDNGRPQLDTVSFAGYRHKHDAQSRAYELAQKYPDKIFSVVKTDCAYIGKRNDVTVEALIVV